MICGTKLTVTDGITTVFPVKEIDFTSGAVVTDLGNGTAGVAVSGSGGSTFQGRYNLSVSGVASGAQSAMSWSHFDGASLLDLSTPTHPTAITGGEYAVAIALSVSGTAVNPGQVIFIRLELDALASHPWTAFSPASGAVTPPATVTQPFISGTWDVAAGGQVNGYAMNFDTISHDFTAFAFVHLRT